MRINDVYWHDKLILSSVAQKVLAHNAFEQDSSLKQHLVG